VGSGDGLAVLEDLTLCDLPKQVRGVELSEALLGHGEELPQMPPVLVREVIEGDQAVPVVLQDIHGLGVPGPIAFLELGPGLESRLPAWGVRVSGFLCKWP